MNKNNLEKIKLIIDTLNHEINSYTPWVARKEIASWTAIAFYLALILSITGFLFKNYTDNINFVDIIFIIIPICFLVIALSVIFSIFIHSQFSSIYDKSALTISLRNNIFKLLKQENIDSIDLKINEKSQLPNFIYDEYKKHNERVRPKNKIHPLNILVNLWTFKWIRKRDEVKFSTHSRQEAAIYSLIILSNITFFILILGILVQFIFMGLFKLLINFSN